MPAFVQDYLNVLRNMYEHHRLYFIVHVFLLASATIVLGGMLLWML
jgi:hypothetical protein